MTKKSLRLGLMSGITVIALLSIALQFNRSEAQTTIQPLKIADITLASSSNPAANYPTNSNGAIQNDNGGISLWTGNFPTPYTECGHVGIQSSNPVIYTTTDPAVANVWQRRAACNGNIAVGGASGDQYAEQTLALTGVTISGGTFTLNVQVPAVLNIQGNMRLYIDDTGGTYHCRADHNYGTLRYPNDCDLTIEQALTPAHLARAGGAPVAGNGLCQSGEDSYTTPQDCGNPKTFSGRAIFQAGDAGGSIGNNTLLAQKVINLTNTGSHPDTFRTTLPVNPETRCGLRASNDPYPANALPNPLPITLDTLLAVNETKYISVVCVTKGLPAGPFTWSYKTISVGALGINRADVNSTIAEVQDTVNITEPIGCSDSDNGMNFSIKGVGTGTYAGAITSYIAIYGQEPNPTSPKATTDKFSTYIDHCANATQLNEAFCDASGRLSALGTPCANGCKDGVCLPPPAPPSQPTPSTSPVGHWKFDGNGNNEIAGGTAAIIVGNASFKPDGGKLNGYAYIPTASDWLKIPYSSTFDLPDSFTIEFWFRQRADRSFFQDLVYKGSPINNYNFRIFRQLWNQYNFGPIITGYTAVRTGFWSQTSNPNQLAHNVWHHVAYTKNTNGSAYYLDGILTHNLDTSQYTEYSGSAKTPPVDIIIGDSAVDTDIDDLKIYNRALSADEVLQESGFPPPAPPPPPPPPPVVGTPTLPWPGSNTIIAPPIGIISPAGSSTAIPISPPVYPGLPLPQGPFPPGLPLFPGTSTLQSVPVFLPPQPLQPQPQIAVPQTAPFSLAQCRVYLAGVRQELKTSKQFWRDTNRELASVKSTYEHASQVSELLARVQKNIIGIEKMTRRGRCDENSLNEIQQKLDLLHTALFSELNSYLVEMDEIFEDEFEVPEELSPQLNRHTESVVEQLGTHVEKLSQDLEKSQQKVEELVGQVAQLKSTLENVTTAATELSEKVIISYKAVSQMKDAFEEERRQILADKDRLIPLVEQAVDVLEKTKCVGRKDRQNLAQEFGQVATVNWISERAQALEKRLRILIASCRAKDLTAEDIRIFSGKLDEMEQANLTDSCTQGLTPFCDVATHEWYYGAMVAGRENGLMIKGFPTELVLQQDALFMLLRAYGMKDSDLIGDCVIPGYARVKDVSPYARCAVVRGLEKGLDLHGRMNIPATRVELASWLSVLFSLPEKPDALKPYRDLKKVSPELKSAIAQVTGNEIMVGHPEQGTFGPFENVTRAALAVALEKVLAGGER